MNPISYLDFDLSIELVDAAQGRYRARVLSSPAGQANVLFEMPFSALELENFLLRMGRTRRGVRYIGSPEMQAAQAFGGRLFTTVFTAQVQSCLQRSLDMARQQQQGLRIRLRLTDAPALADLPWEFVYDSVHHHFLAYSTMTPLVRYLDLPQTSAPLMIQPPLKVLVMIANPRDLGYAVLDVEDEWRKVQNALAGLEERGLVQVTRLQTATLSELQRQLRREQYHIFHFIGHGGFDQQTQSGVLLMEDEQGRSRLVSGYVLGALLRDTFSLRLALLNACEGARTSLNDPFAGVAQHLVQQGIPAVIAMQFEITDRAAIRLAHEFYNALADNYGVDAALAEARKAIYAEGNDIEWGTPVLFMRTQNGQIFDVAPIRQDVHTKNEDTVVQLAQQADEEERKRQAQEAVEEEQRKEKLAKEQQEQQAAEERRKQLAAEEEKNRQAQLAAKLEQERREQRAAAEDRKRQALRVAEELEQQERLQKQQEAEEQEYQEQLADENLNQPKQKKIYKLRSAEKARLRKFQVAVKLEQQERLQLQQEAEEQILFPFSWKQIIPLLIAIGLLLILISLNS